MSSLKNETSTQDKSIILNYRNANEENFFENNIYTDENRPKWGDIRFVLENKTFSHKLGIDEFYDRCGKDDTKEIPQIVWKTLKKYLYFDENNKYPQNMRCNIQNEEFINLVQNAKIKRFEDFGYSKGESLIDATKRLKIETYSSMYEYLCKGKNIGNCGMTSKLLMLLYGDKIEYHRGYMKEMENTENSPQGQHAWLELGNLIFDTSLLLVIPKKYKEQLGYITKSKMTKKELIEMCEKSPTDVEEVFYRNYKIRKLEVSEGYYDRDDKDENYKYPRENRASFNEYIKNVEKVLKPDKENVRGE